jgi:hypothetical protein
MKIGILTVPFNNNYGGFLQEYGLMSALKKMGHDVWFIDLQYHFTDKNAFKQLARTVNGLVKRYVLKRDNPVFANEKRLYSVLEWQRTRPFVDKYLSPKLSPVYSSKELRYLISNMQFDAFICGSDQIWRPKYLSHFIKTMYFDFLEGRNEKRFSYAASFGTDKWEYSDKLATECKALIKKFGAVSVREDSGVVLCEKYFGVKAQHVLDPTLLLEQEDYVKLIIDADIEKSSGNLFCYILDKSAEKQDLIDKVAQKKNLTSFYLDIHSKIKQPVEVWLRAFYDVEFIVTDSFHGMVFAIIFNKPFLVIGNLERGIGRFTSLLNVLSLQKRLITDNFHDIDNIINQTIDYDIVNSVLEKEKSRSFDYLHSITGK